MTGHLQIIQARIDGLKPAAIFFTDAKPLQSGLPFDHPEAALSHCLYPEVYLDDKDLTQRLDLRFVAACRVLINTAQVTAELITVAERAAECGASTVCLASPDEIILYREKEWNAWTS